MSEDHDDHDYSLESARAAAERGDLDDWVARFLASPGSDNAPLARELTARRRWWYGPVQVPIDQLERLAGPPDHPVLVPLDDHEWRDDVEDLADRVGEERWHPPPVIVTYENGTLRLEDGNHRVEALRQAGEEHAWAVIAFHDPTERDRFADAPPG